MERRNSNIGCIVAGLSLILAVCLLPHLVSAVYSIVGTVLQVPGPSEWLWGEAVNRVAGGNDLVYAFLAEGPICCVGVLALFLMILGMLVMLGGRSPAQEEPADDEDSWFDEPGAYYEEPPID